MKTWQRWLLRLGAIPVGFIVGAFITDYIYTGMLHAEGKGHSHNDMIAMAFAAFAGGFGGALILAAVVWVATMKKKREIA